MQAIQHRLRGRIRPGIPKRLLDGRLSHQVSCTDMRVGVMYDYLVGYAVQELWDTEANEYWRSPVGTLFFVHHSAGPGAGDVRYAITCRHVIEAMKRDGARDVFVRLNMADGFASDFATSIDDWVLSNDSDVAAIRFELPREGHFWSYPIERVDWLGLMEGTDLFFIGMFSLLPGSV